MKSHNQDIILEKQKKIEEQKNIIEAQKARIKQLEVRVNYYKDSFNEISNSFFWRITKPARCAIYFFKKLPKYIGIAKTKILRFFIRSVADAFTKEELEKQCSYQFIQNLKFSVIAPLYNTSEKYLKEMIESVIVQTYGDWELCMADGSDEKHSYVGNICREYSKKDSRILYKKLDKNLGISANTNACLEMATGDYIALLDHDDLLHPAALYEVMRAICEKGADFIYTDEANFKNKPRDAFRFNFKSAYAPDTICGVNYICHFTVFKRSLLDIVGLFDSECDGSQDHDMVLRLTEKAKRIAHIPEILYYWRAHENSTAENLSTKNYAIKAGVRAVEKRLKRLGMNGKVSPVAPNLSYYRIKYAINGSPKISILIPNYEHLEDLKKCLNSIFEKTTYQNYEIVIVENNSTSFEVFSYYEKLEKEKENVKVVVYSGIFNYPAINNYGAKFCSGEYILLLNNDTEVITPDWIEEMLMFAQRNDVGAVGAKLYYPDGTIQHGGVILKIGGVAAHSHNKYFNRFDYGYMGRLSYAQNLSAVTAACMLIKRSAWNELNGLDENYAVAFNDVDLCMRIRQAGYLIVWTPFAELFHYESKSRGIDNDDPDKMERLNKEASYFMQKWKKELETGDIYYNPNLTLKAEDFSFVDDIVQHDARVVIQE